MRFYDVQVSSPAGQALLRASSLDARGQNARGALQVELDIVTFSYALPMGGSYVRIWGIPLKVISQATNLNYASVIVRGGMSRGLPLANSAQQGVLAQGTILPAFGNWVGTEMTLDLVLAPPLSAVQSPTGALPNLVLDWPAGTRLGDALGNALRLAYPGLKVEVAVSDKLVANNDQPASYANLEQLASFVLQRSRAILNQPSYPGVGITVSGGTVRAYDGTVGGEVKQINFQDLIGQPTWIGPLQLQFKCPMRGDLAVGQLVKMPPTLTTQTAQSALVERSRSVFQGSFLVQQVRHTGSFRQPDAGAWATTVDAVSLAA